MVKRKINMRNYYYCQCDRKCSECIYFSRLTGELYYCEVFGFVLAKPLDIK